MGDNSLQRDVSPQTERARNLQSWRLERARLREAAGDAGLRACPRAPGTQEERRKPRSAPSGPQRLRWREQNEPVGQRGGRGSGGTPEVRWTSTTSTSSSTPVVTVARGHIEAGLRL